MASHALEKHRSKSLDNLFDFKNQTFARIEKRWNTFKKLRETNKVTKHFSTYLSTIEANSQAYKEAVYSIRHNVYCEELNYEPIRANGFETDEFDAFSAYCLIQHNVSKSFAGTVRMVTPTNNEQQLPIEKYCLDTITDLEYSPLNFDRNDICEISRLAVPEEFRRRKSDQYKGAATGAFGKYTYSEDELRCFPMIAVGLYFSAAAISYKQKRPHVFVMMEPRLARGMGYVGIKFKQIGPVVDYHGKRAPYYIYGPSLKQTLPKGFLRMLKHIERSIKE